MRARFCSSRTQNVKADKLDQCVHLLREHNKDARIVTTPWDELTGQQMLDVVAAADSLAEELLSQMEHEHHHEHEHPHHEHGEDCTCGCHDHEHHHEHEHPHHEHGEDCTCGCHDHDHEHHHADEVFQSWGAETPKKFTEAELQSCLTQLGDIALGTVLRAKGIVPCADGGWLHFDYVPGMPEVRHGAADYTGRLCVIGAGLDESGLADLFGI